MQQYWKRLSYHFLSDTAFLVIACWKSITEVIKTLYLSKMNNNHICSIPASIYDSSETLIKPKCIKLKQKQGFYLLHWTYSWALTIHLNTQSLIMTLLCIITLCMNMKNCVHKNMELSTWYTCQYTWHQTNAYISIEKCYFWSYFLRHDCSFYHHPS